VAPAVRVSNLRHELTFDRTTASARTLKVATTFDASGPGPVLLSLPAWTPGAYEIANFARNVRAFAAVQGGTALGWDKADPDTWRIRVTKAGPVTVSFDYLADDLDNARAWSRSDFLMVNGTNVFLYPEPTPGRAQLTLPATVSIKTEPDWSVATGMRPAGAPRTYREANYHDLADMPIFVGALDVDSVTVSGKVTRVATWPAGVFRGAPRLQFLSELGKSIPAMAKVFGSVPWDDYTVMIIFDPAYGGASALEHQNSHVGIYTPAIIGTTILPSITAHEIFHAWNVKRLRPADLWPYRYDQAQPTPWLWVSEGITDYYADLALVRSGITDSAGWLGLVQEKVDETISTVPVALEDASLSTWIHPEDGTGSIYYPKGALAGLLLDIMIRDASDNRRSLDGVMARLYQQAWQATRGFTGDEWWAAVQQAAGGRSFTEFAAKYIDGRESFPWEEILPLAGLRLTADSIREPRIGVSSSTDSSGALVLEIVPGSMAERAGVRVGDRLISVGEVITSTDDFGASYRARYGTTPEGTMLPMVVERGDQRLTLQGPMTVVVRTVRQLQFLPDAGEKALRIRKGLLSGG
jgi:predicted metalloprotease with PDZ domain